MKIVQRKLYFLVGHALVAGSISVAAPLTEDQQKRDWEQRWIDRNISISEMFDRVAEGLDLFLAGGKVTDDPNETTVFLQNSTYVMDGEGVKNGTGVGVHLRLPNLEKYWHLKFTSYDEREERRGVREKYLRQTPRQQSYGATVGLIRKLGDVRTSFEPRIELQDPLKVSHSLTFESVGETRNIEINPKLEFFASPEKGVGNFIAFNLNQRLSKVYSLTFINEWEYLERLHRLSATNGVSLGQRVDSKSSLSYNFMVGANNRDNYHMDGYSFAVSWNQTIYRRILDYSITPHLNFDESHSFKGRPGIVFSVTLTF